MKHIFIIGSKGIPARYGGFETFVEELVRNRKSDDVKYHVACLSNQKKNFEYLGADCFEIPVPNIGPAKAVYYDIAAFRYCLSVIKKEQIKEPVIYVLACRIGPFIGSLKKKLKRMGGTLLVNPDGHEWMRAKWNAAIRKYWKFSEKLMVKHADLLVCDSKNIENYIQAEYGKYQPKTTFIAYGTNTGSKETENATVQKTESRKKLLEWYQKFGLKEKEYYLVVGRFVPENNYETMLLEFMKSKTKKKFVLITNVEQNKFFEELKQKTHFDEDDRIKFVGTVYDSELLTMIRKNAFAYFHGHEVGGTNPSLLEALSTTELNLLLKVGFNEEVAEDGALYWTKDAGSLSYLMKIAESLDETRRTELCEKARARMKTCYSWDYIVGRYEELWNKFGYQ